MPTLSAGKAQVLKVLVPTPAFSPSATPLYQSADRALEQRGREEKEHTFIINIINTRWAGFPQDIGFLKQGIRDWVWSHVFPRSLRFSIALRCHSPQVYWVSNNEPPALPEASFYITPCINEVSG